MVVISTGILASVNPVMFLEQFAGIAGLMADAGADFAVIAPLYTTMSLGWAAGKLTAVSGGAAAVKTFSQINAIPMVGMIAISKKYDDKLGMGIWGVFLAAYVYFGYVAGKSKKK